MPAIRVMPCCVVLIASTAQAGALITLFPTNPGPYAGGETFPVDVLVTTDRTIDFRLLGFDFSQTDAGIQLLGPDGGDADTTPEFIFDFPIWGMTLYAQFPNFPTPKAVYSSMDPVPGYIYTMSAGVPYHAGSLYIRLPNEPGTYTLDAANYLAIDVNYGASIYFDFANTQIWSTVSDGNVEITGGQFDFTVIPEPTTLILLTFGGLAVPSFRFRRNRQARLVTPSVYHRVKAMQMPCVPPIAPATGSSHCCS